MRHQHAAAIVLALAAALTACTSGSGADAKPKASAKTSPSPTKASALALGQATRWSDKKYGISGTTTALAYTQPVSVPSVDLKSIDYAKDSQWATLDVKVCTDASSKTISVSQTPWQLAFKDSTRTPAPSISGSGIPKPEFPTADTDVLAGDCVRGLISFVVDKGTRPDRIVYDTQDSDPIVWTVPAK